MKHNKFLCILLILTVLLSGCQLAVPEASKPKSGDRLIGVYLTTEPLNFEPYEIPVTVGWNGELQIDEDANQAGRRIYAEFATETLTGDDGTTVEHCDYVFEGIEGAAIYTAYIVDEEGGYYSSTATEGMTGVKHGIGVHDEREEITMSGTVYVSPSETDCVIHFNPIYQQADGQVYVQDGSSFGFAVGEGNRSEGDVYAQKMEETVTVTQNGEPVETTTIVDVSLSLMFHPEAIVLLQLDEHGAVLDRKEYAPGQLPERLTPETGTAYFVVETHKRDPNGNSVVSREIFDREDKHLSAFYAGEHGLCSAQPVELLWPEEQ